MRNATILPLLLASIVFPVPDADTAGAYDRTPSGSQLYGFIGTPEEPAQDKSLVVDDDLLQLEPGATMFYGADAGGSAEPVSGNTLTLRTTGSQAVGSVYGGYADGGLDHDIDASGNTLLIESGFARAAAAGGWVNSYGSARDNRVLVSGGGFRDGDLVGGFTADFFGTASGNGVSVTGGTFDDAAIAGGYHYSFGAAQGNSVAISGGTFRRSPGTERIGAGIIAGGCSRFGPALNNSVTISGGTFSNIAIAGGAAGGESEDGLLSATGNTVTIQGSPVFENVSLFGGMAVPEEHANPAGDMRTGNTLRIYDQANLRVSSIANFSAYDFRLCNAAFRPGASVLVITSSGGTTDLGGSPRFKVALSSDAGVPAGRTVHLMTELAGAFKVNGALLDATPRKLAEGLTVRQGVSLEYRADVVASARHVDVVFAGTPADEPDPEPEPQPQPGPDPQPEPEPAPQDGTKDDKKESRKEEEKQNGKQAKKPETRRAVQASRAPARLRQTLSGPRVSQRTRAIAAGSAAGLVHLNTAGDLVAGQTMESLRAAIPGDAPRFAFVPFAAVSAGVVRSQGAHARLAPAHLTAGIAGVLSTPDLCFAAGPFFETGRSRLATDHSFAGEAPVSGSGRLSHVGAGLLSRLDVKRSWLRGLYAEASFRTGSLETVWKTDDMVDGFTGRRAGYDLARIYTAAHAGLGWRLPLAEQAALDLGARYFWTRLQGESVHVASDPYEFKSAQSSRLKFTAKASLFEGGPCTPYVSASWEREFDGTSRAEAFGLKAPESTLRGDTASFGLGFRIGGFKDSGLSIDFGASAQTGVQKGVSGSVLVKYEF